MANFISLPKVNGQVVPIGYLNAGQGSGSYGSRAYSWFFPVGTVIGEVIYVKSPDGELYVSEVRTRKRYKDNWATNVYRPFPTAAHLASAIRRLRPNYESIESLRSIVAHLQNNDNLVPTSLIPKLGSQPVGSDNRYRGDQVVTTIENRLAQVFTANGAVDTIPAFNDPQLIKELLTKTTFVSSYGLAWKKSGSVETFAASTQESFSVVPSNYKAWLIAVTEASCHRCHSFAGQELKQFDSQTVAYGKLWGDDGIFSFQPFETSMFYSKIPNNLGSHVINFNNDDRRIRKDFLEKSIITLITNPNDSPLYNELPKATVR